MKTAALSLLLISLYSSAMASRQVDSEREQFFGRQFVPVLKHQDIDTTLSASFKQLLTLNATSSSLVHQSDEKGASSNPQLQSTLRTARENYKRYLLLKAKTVYSLPEAFKEGYLFSPKQATQALHKMGIDPQRIDKEKFWMFCVRCLELPDPRLDQESDNMISFYLDHLRQIKERHINRLKEDAFALTTFTAPALQRNISLPSSLAPVQDPVSSRFLRPSREVRTALPDENRVVQIVSSYKFSTAGISGIIEIIQSVDPVSPLERICRGLNAEAKSWRNPDACFMPVRVAEKLRENPNADLRPEIIETVDILLARNFNRIILERIEKNFEAALAPRGNGFESNLPDDVF